MCLAIPGQIKSIDDDRQFAAVEVASVRRRVNIDLLREEPLQVGDWVLIHVGFAMSRISAEYAAEQLRLLAMLGEVDAALGEIEGYDFAEENPEPERKPGE